MLLAQQGRPAEAAHELETLIADDPVPASAFALGLLYGQMGRWQEAARALARCLEEDPAYPRARYNRALALAKAGETTAALDELERAADDPAARAEAVRTLVDLSRQVNDKARLERWVLEAARLDRDAAVAARRARAARALSGQAPGGATRAGHPARHAAQVGLVGGAEATAERRLLDAHDPPVRRAAERDGEQQQRRRLVPAARGRRRTSTAPA